MDYSSGVVGKARGISYQSIGEFLYIEPRPGVKTVQVSRESIRRAVSRLESIGLINRIGLKDCLIFRMPFAQQDKYARKKADRGATPHSDSPKAAPLLDSGAKADRGVKAQADTPPVSGISILLTSSSIEPSYTSENKNDDDDEKLIYHRTLHQDTRTAIQKMLKGFNPEVRQELLDELSGYINLNRIRATPEGLMLAMIKSYKAGGFSPTMAHKVRAARERPPERPQQSTAKTPEQKKQSIAAARKGLATVHQILGMRGKR